MSGDVSTHGREGLAQCQIPADNPNGHVVSHHESGIRISFEVLSVGDTGGNAEVGVELDDAFVTNWQSSLLNPGQQEVGFVQLGRLEEGEHSVLVLVNPGVWSILSRDEHVQRSLSGAFQRHCQLVELLGPNPTLTLVANWRG